MKLLENNQIRLKKIRFRFQKSWIYINERFTWHKIYGTVLKQAIQINSYYLLFVSNEESEEPIDICHMYLINSSGRTLESWILSAAFIENLGDTFWIPWIDYEIDYKPLLHGYLYEFKLLPPNKITFRFKDNIYSIEVLDKPLYPWSANFSKKEYQERHERYGDYAFKQSPKLGSRLKFDCIKKFREEELKKEYSDLMNMQTKK